MKHSRIRIFSIFLLFIIISFSVIPFVLAKERKTYIIDFLYDCEVNDEGFSNSAEDTDEISIEATAYALEILDDFDALQKKDIFQFEVEHEVNTTDLPDFLEDEAKDTVSQGENRLYNLYFFLKSLYILEDHNDEYSMSSSLEDNIKNYCDTLLQLGGGYAPTPTSDSATLASTYFALAIYDLLDESYANKSITKYWIITCINTDGGYGGTPELESTVQDTYYAILAMDLLGDVSDLYYEDATIEYLESFYEDDENNSNNYGGYYPDEDSEITLISSTLFCLMGINLIDNDEIDNVEETLEWLKNRQNFRDGGFADLDDEYEQKDSSVINSYYALQLINLLDAEIQPFPATLDEKVFMLEFIWLDWLIFAGLLIAVGVIVVVIIIIRRRRRV